MGSLSWSYSASDLRFYNYSLPIKSHTDITSAFNGISSEYLAIPLQRFVYNQSEDATMAQNNNYIFIRNLSYTDVTAFKNAMNGVQLVYELATPQTYQLTPAQLRSLVGTNNLTSSTGEVTEVEYIRNETISWVIDQIQDNSVVWTVIP